MGLGNPGAEYDGTYHNAGRMFVEYLAKKNGLTFERPSKKLFEYAKQGPHVLAVPKVFMNDSGRAALEALAYFKRPAAPQPGDFLIAHDDSDIALGDYKVSVGGGAAGHHGIESIIATLGTPEFARLRFGIRPQDEDVPRKKAGDFVLAPMPEGHRTLLYGAFDAAIVNVIKNDTP